MIIQVLRGYASTPQQHVVLEQLVRGETKVSFSMSEPDGGTDVARAMKTRATKIDSGWRINGTKLSAADRLVGEDRLLRGRHLLLKKGAREFGLIRVP